MPNQGPYRIVRISDTGVSIVRLDKPTARPKCVAWERLRHCDEQLENEPGKPVPEELPETTPTPQDQWKDRL